MNMLIVNGQSYDMDALSEDARAQVTNLQFVDTEMARLQAQLAVCQTARNAYVQALKPHLTPTAALDVPAVRLTH